MHKFFLSSKFSLAGPMVLLALTFLTVVFFSFGIHTVYESKPFLAFINIVFLSIFPFAVAYISSSSYLKSGLMQFLLMGAAMVIFGICNLIAALGILSVSGLEWTNFLVTVHNIGVLAFAATSFCASVIISTNISTFALNPRRRRNNLTLAYVSAVILAVFLAFLTLAQDIPTFVLSGGFSLLRQSVLGGSVVLLVISAILFGKKYLDSRSSVVYWYSLGLGLLGLGIVGILLEPNLGTPLSWIGRVAQYAACGFFVVAAVSRFQLRTADESWVDAFGTNRSKLLGLFSNMLDGFSYHQIVINLEGKPVDYVFLAVNDAFERLTGLRRGDILNRKATEVLPGIEHDPAAWIDVYGHVALTGEPFEFESFSHDLAKWFRVSAYCPEKGYFATIFEDITERKKAEEEIRKLNEHFDMAQRAAGVGVWNWDVKTGKIEWTAEMFKLFSLDPKTTIASFDTWNSVLHPEDRKQAGVKIEEALKNKSFLDNEYRIVRPNGQIVWINALGQGEYDSLQRPIRMTGICIDITERKKAEKALKETEMQLRLILENSRDGINLLDLKTGKYVFMSPAQVKLTGFSTEEINGVSAEEAYERTHPDDRHITVEQQRRVAAGEDMSESVEYRWKVKSGEYRWFSDSRKLVRDEKGQPIALVGISRDITVRKNSEIALDEARNKLQQYTEGLEQLVEERTKKLRDSERLAAIGATAGMVGHDIRNPLQAITSDAYLAKSELEALPDSEQKKMALESIQEIEKNTEYINKIVQDLQDYARPLKPKIEESDLGLVVEGLFAKNVLPQNIDVEVDVKKNARKIWTDTYYLNRILVNLVTNSVQAMSDGGKLTIQARKDGQDTILSVKDTGVGIPESVKDKMFTIMFTTKSKGQGFGLSVVKRMTESLGGTVAYESEEGKGTTFTVRLPPKNSA